MPVYFLKPVEAKDPIEVAQDEGTAQVGATTTLAVAAPAPEAAPPQSTPEKQPAHDTVEKLEKPKAKKKRSNATKGTN